jgi:hypothetical protein
MNLRFEDFAPYENPNIAIAVKLRMQGVTGMIQATAPIALILLKLITEEKTDSLKKSIEISLQQKNQRRKSRLRISYKLQDRFESAIFLPAIALIIIGLTAI